MPVGPITGLLNWLGTHCASAGTPGMLVRPAGFPSVDAMLVQVPSANVEAVAVSAMIIVVSERVRSMRQTFREVLGTNDAVVTGQL